MVTENKDSVLQIKITKSERVFLEKFILKKSFLEHKRYTMSGFLSRSLMEKMHEEYEKFIEGDNEL